jgi:flagellar hook assembly protein FlgD
VYLESGGDANIAFSLDEAAPEVTIVIEDSSGNPVRTIVEHGLGEGDHVVNWDGADDNGDQVGAGMYQVSIQGVDGNDNAFTVETLLRGNVDGVVYRDGSALLLINGQEIPLGAVVSVKEA